MSTTDRFDDRDDSTLRSRIAENPRPLAIWLGVASILLLLELGAFLGGVFALADAFVMSITAVFDVLLSPIAPGLAAGVVEIQQTISNFISGLRHFASSLPTLLSRELIPNQGYQAGPNGPWKETFLGLAPAYAWAIRVLLVAAYAAFSFYWAARGWFVFREHYRYADWTPTDDMVDRLRTHYWGLFGIIVLCAFLTMALFAPTLGTSTVDKNIVSPYSHNVSYYSEETNQVETVTVGYANFNSKSKGAGDQNVGPLSYDNFGRFHPFGTLPNGRDLFTFMMGGARISMIVAGIAIGISAFIATTMSLFASYYGGLLDLTTLTIADGIISVPQLLLLILVSVVFQSHWLAGVLNGGFLVALVFALTGWPFMWRAIRGPALQVAQEEWIDAAKSYGQTPAKIMRKHMLPYVLGYILIYASMTLGSTIIALASLSFLGNGLGISPPTPAWGRAISLGQSYVSTQSWHISLIPGIMIVFLVMASNALGDGIRDAIDPESNADAEDTEAAGGAA